VRREPEYHEGPDAARRFERAIGQVLTVSKTELLKREAAWKKDRKAKKARTKKSA
jgi:hypothetical protein